MIIKDLLRVLLKSVWMPRLKNQVSSQNNEIHILGTGPSIMDSADKILKRPESDVMVLNDFAFSDYFIQLRPRYCMLIDPVYWIKDDKVHEEGSAERERLFNCLVEKTNWNLDLFIPSQGVIMGVVESKIKENAFIHIRPVNIYNLTPRSSRFYFYLLDHNLTAPSQNVLATALVVSILLGYKFIGLHGAEHSWLESMRVNDNNVVCHVNKHFYEEPEEWIPWIGINGEPREIHTILSNLSKTFKSYQIINDYANSKNVRIVNYTPHSYIDAFERKTTL